MLDHPDPRPAPTALADRQTSSLAGLRFALAGPGRVGRSLARWAVDRGASLELIVRRTPSAAASAIAAPGTSELSFEQLAAHRRDSGQPGAPLDLLLLTVSDHALATVAEAWSRALGGRPTPPFAAVLHSSGCFDAQVLAPLRAVGVAVGSLHPLQAFAGEVATPGPRPFFAVDGDPSAAALARRLVAAWHGDCCELSGDRRVAYHLAASLAAGGVTTVVAAVAQLMRDADLPEEVLPGYLRLLAGAVEVATAEGAHGVARAITGPAARGDEATLARHLAALRTTSPGLEPLVRALWRETRRQTGRAGEGDDSAAL